MRIIEFYPSDSPCSYIEGFRSSFRYFFIEECEEYFYQGLLERGYRRFGKYFFAPVCRDCDVCKTIRQNTFNFEFSKNHKRVFLKNQHIKITLSRPSFSHEKLELYHRYHLFMHHKKGWNYQEASAEYYHDTFVSGYGDFGYELEYFFQDRLIAVGYVDILKSAVSAIYFFYDHSFGYLSLGTLNILMQIKMAKERNIAYFYPGYWIKNHHSLGYKSRFQPFEILQNRPDIFDSTIYQLYEEKK